MKCQSNRVARTDRIHAITVTQFAQIHNGLKIIVQQVWAKTNHRFIFGSFAFCLSFVNFTTRPQAITHPWQALRPTRIVSVIFAPEILSTFSNEPRE